eukprot:scaffold36006_cov168-Amphora_coffeaeformis.AAC.4
MKSMFCASVTKTTATSYLGLRLWSPPTPNAPVLIVRLDDHGLFAGKLKAGLQITQINDVDCQAMTIAKVEAYLAQLVGRVTVWGSAPQPTKAVTPPAKHLQPICAESSPMASAQVDCPSTIVSAMEDYLAQLVDH